MIFEILKHVTEQACFRYAKEIVELKHVGVEVARGNVGAVMELNNFIGIFDRLATNWRDGCPEAYESG